MDNEKKRRIVATFGFKMIPKSFKLHASPSANDGRWHGNSPTEFLVVSSVK